MILPEWWVEYDAKAAAEWDQRVRRDPLVGFRWQSRPSRQMARFLSYAECLLRGGNSSGKTTPYGAVAVALARGVRFLDGVRLPEVKVPNTGWILSQTYRQQVDAAQAAVVRWLGEHPHKVGWLQGDTRGVIEQIYVATEACKHGMDVKCPTCSRIAFHIADSQSGVGGRVDWVWADEPPKEQAWRELRMRGHGDRKLVRWITATPLEKEWWHWMPEDFNGCERRVREGRIEFRVSIRDNRALSPEVLQEKLDAMANDPYAKARENGDYVDMAGDCPFPIDRLELWMRRARKPRIEEVLITAEKGASEGHAQVMVRCPVEIFHDVEPDEEYVGVLDPSLMLFLLPGGVVSNEPLSRGRVRHDPAGLHIYSRRRPRLVARFSGYSGAYGLGMLGAKLGKRYRNAHLDPETNVGPSVLKALSDARYYNLVPGDWNPALPNHTSPVLGFKTNIINRGQMTDSIVNALLEDSVLVESEAAIKSLMNVTVSKTEGGKDRWQAAWGSHDEDMICMGRALYLMAANRLPPLPRVDKVGQFEKAHGVMLRGRELTSAGVRWGPA